MKFLKNLGMLIVIIAVVLLAGRWYLGGFSTPVVQEKAMAPYVIAYTTFTGNYKNVGPVMDKLYAALSGAGITSMTGIGIYYDNPDTTASSGMRSDIGSIISQSDFAKLNKKSPDYKLKVVEGGTMMVVEFPYKNTLSYIVGPMKVYPIVGAYMKEKGYDMMVPRVEIYGVAAKTIYFIAEIVK